MLNEILISADNNVILPLDFYDILGRSYDLKTVGCQREDTVMAVIDCLL